MILECANKFSNLFDVKYDFLIARKGKILEFSLTFSKTDFHHIAGIHKLKDIFIAQRGSREEIFDKIIKGEINQNLIEKSDFYSEIKERISSLIHLEEMLDSENLVFKYRENVQIYSQIKAEYLLEGKIDGKDIFLFLSPRDFKNSKNQICRSFFPKTTIDYSIGQPKYALLKKTKTKISTNKVLKEYIKKSDK